MPKFRSVSALPLTLPLKVIIAVTVGLYLFGAVNLTITHVYAKDKCEAISDLDERAKCYADKIEDKEKDYESMSKKLSDVGDSLDEILGKINELAGQLNVTQAQINELQADINALEAQLAEINTNLDDRRASLREKITLRNLVVRNYAKRAILNDLEILFSWNGALISFGETGEAKTDTLSGFQFTALSQEFNESLGLEALKLITSLNAEIDNFEKDKKEAEDLKTDVETAQQNLLAIKGGLEGEKSGAEGEKENLEEQEGDLKEELADLSAEIAKLNAKQQEILAEKGGTGYYSLGDYQPPEAKVPDPPFKPAFAAISYGAYTHYDGMSQYGAKGRAEEGQDYKEILKFYYKSDVKEKDDFPDKIKVDGYGEMSFQKYLYGLGEMPSDWPKDALKAQAIAARSYAYYGYVKKGRSICTTQSCQVYIKSKADNPPDRWKEAVDDTKKEILDDPPTSRYSSTTGGYINNVGWDSKGSWPGGAYEKRAESPWFYKAWYTQSYHHNSSTCGRDTPWLKESEIVDILNSWVVWRKGSGDEKDHITPVTTNCWGGDPYSHDKMAEKADKYGSKFTGVSSVSVEQGSNGQTMKVKFDTNRGETKIDGAEFKTVFNLRAPAYVSIRNRLFDIERRN